ncbi:MAG: glycosyltransferase family 39 protein [Chloroflexota bacterium]
MLTEKLEDQFNNKYILWIEQYSLFFILLITLFAGAIRFYKLGEWSFWEDEMFTVSNKEDGFNYSILRQSTLLTLIRYFVAQYGVTEWNARALPAIVGTISIPAITFSLRTVVEPVTRVLFALFLALAPWHLYWSQNARFYVALLLFYTLALITFYIGLEKDRPSLLFVSLIFLALATKERLLALFLAPTVGAYILLIPILKFERPAGYNWRNFNIFVLPGIIGGLAFLAPYLRNLSGWMEGFGYANNNGVWLFAGYIFFVGLPTLVLGTFSGVYLLIQKDRLGLLLFISALIPIVTLMSISSFHYTANRYAFVSISSWILLVSLGVAQLLNFKKLSSIILVSGLVCFLAIQPMSDNFLYFRYQNGNRDNWKQAFLYVKTNIEDGDIVVTDQPVLANFYLDSQSLNITRFDLENAKSTNQRIWFVENIVTREIYPQHHQWFWENGRLVSEFDVHLPARTYIMRVYLYTPIN